jgi:high-affinity iron transporter
MLPTFIIGLREGVEAALIVGIIAAFLAQEGRRDALRQVWIGISIAVAICIAVAVGLDVLNEELPQRQQEMLETVIALMAVAIVTFMIFWMRRNARHLKGELHTAAADALTKGSAIALIGMAFFAVLREGIETVVFLLAVFQGATDPASAGIGALLGILCAVLIGYGIYRGGVRLNLQKFFKFTAVVLVFVAAGLLSGAAHTAWEAGWLTSFQEQAVDLSWLVVPGTWTSSLLTGMLGLQSIMTQAEVFLYLAYLVPMLAYVLWPESRRAGARRASVGAKRDVKAAGAEHRSGAAAGTTRA